MGIFRRFLIKSYERKISRYIDMLKTLDDNQIGGFLAEAITIRVDFENGDLLPTIELDDGSISPHIHNFLFYLEKLQFAIKQFRKMGITSATLAQILLLEVWLYSIQTALKPELKAMRQQMWLEFERGMPYVRTALDKIIAQNPAVRPGMPFGSRRRVYDILDHLPPKFGSQETGEYYTRNK